MLLLLNSALPLNRSCAPYSTLLFRYQGNRGSSEHVKAGTESHVGGFRRGGVIAHTSSSGNNKPDLFGGS